MFGKALVVVVVMTLLAGCSTTQTHQTVETQKVASYGTAYSGPKTTLVVGKFNNRSDYMQGLFSSNIDRLGNQAKTILKTHLQQTNRFNIVDRENMEGIRQEAALAGTQQNLKGARYAVTGGVSEFGRKEVGDKQFFGILGSGKKQIAYSKVSLNVVDVVTSEVVYSVQGAGEYALSNREVMGFGSTAGYDATLNGKVLNLAITDAVNQLVGALESGAFGVE